MKERRRQRRRELLKMAPLAVAGLLLTGEGRRRVTSAGLSMSDWAGAATFGPARLAATFDDRDVTPLDRFPLNSYLMHDPEIDLDRWQLEMSGLVRRPGAYALDALRQLPKITQNTRHVCIEGWDVIGSFGGVALAAWLDHVGASEDAAYIQVSCADDYRESIDMASARHPQTLLCYEMYGAPLSRVHGAPLRLVMPTKLGYKQAKYIVGLEVTDVLTTRGYWGDQGYPWHGGL